MPEIFNFKFQNIRGICHDIASTSPPSASPTLIANVSRDFALRGAFFPENFVRVYPRPLYKSGLAAPLRSAESAVIPLKYCKDRLTLPQAKNPALGMPDHAGRH
jgi:hypothetical protein